MAHTILMGDDGILRSTLLGNLGTSDMESYIRDLNPYLDASTESSQIRSLLDSSQSGQISSGARKKLMELNSDMRLGKIAVIGASRRFRVLVGFISKATNRNNFNFFDAESPALDWLKKK